MKTAGSQVKGEQRYEGYTRGCDVAFRGFVFPLDEANQCLRAYF